MAQTKRHHVFISHASEDKPLVRELYARLKRDGFDVWLDEESLLPGQDWEFEIQKTIENAAAIIVCLSSNSLAKEGFVQKELKLVLDVASEKPEGTIHIIPARLDESPVPVSLRKYQWANLFDDAGYEKLKQALKIINSPEVEDSARLSRTSATNTKPAQVTVILERDIREFTQTEQASFIFALSQIVNVDSEQIKIVRIASGSVILTLEMPEESAKILVSLFLQKDSLLSDLSVSKVELKHSNQAPAPLTVSASVNSSSEINNYEKSVFVSYAWDGESEQTVSKIEKAFSKKGITIVRDKRDLEYKGSIEAFEQRISKGQCIVLVISDKYLRSEHCMYELVELANNRNLRERVFPIVLPDAKIYKAIDRLNYIQYWDEKIEQLNQAIKQIGVMTNLAGISADLDKYARIRASFDNITDLLSDMNALTPEIHSENDFSILVNAVEHTMIRK
jgi:hypothetical protein